MNEKQDVATSSPKTPETSNQLQTNANPPKETRKFDSPNVSDSLSNNKMKQRLTPIEQNKIIDNAMKVLYRPSKTQFDNSTQSSASSSQNQHDNSWMMKKTK